MKKFNHVALSLNDDKKVVYTAQFAKNFHLRMLICKFVFDKGSVPLNPFTTFGYYLYELVERNLVRNANNNLLKRSDELWVFGEISDGIIAEVKIFKKLNKPIRYFDITNIPKKIVEIKKMGKIKFEGDLEKNRKNLLKELI